MVSTTDYLLAQLSISAQATTFGMVGSVATSWIAIGLSKMIISVCLNICPKFWWFFMIVPHTSYRQLHFLGYTSWYQGFHLKDIDMPRSRTVNRNGTVPSAPIWGGGETCSAAESCLERWRLYTWGVPQMGATTWMVYRWKILLKWMV